MTCSPPGNLPDPGIEPGSPALQADALPSEPQGKLQDSNKMSLADHGAREVVDKGFFFFFFLTLLNLVCTMQDHQSLVVA